MSEEETTLRIRELDLNTIPPSFERMYNPEQGGVKLVVIGMPGTGKSTLIESVLNSKKHVYPMGVVMSGTEDDNKTPETCQEASQESLGSIVN
jgi:GTPase SAR1 family protein